MDSVYIETTIVGHIAGRVHRDSMVAARQQITRDWWQNEASGYEAFISQVVLEECSQDDPSAAGERHEVVKDMDLLESSDDVDELANALISEKAVPASEARDAFHIAIAAVNGVAYFVDVELQAQLMRRSGAASKKCAATRATSHQLFAHRRNSWRSTMVPNPITEEIREIRHHLAAQFENDVYRIGAENRRGQAASGHRVIRRPKRQPVVSNTTNKSMHPIEMGGRDSA